MTTYYWLSFCDPDREEGDQFLGAAIVPASNGIEAAVSVAWDLGCNPGGEVVMIELPEGDLSKYAGKLMNRQEAESWAP